MTEAEVAGLARDGWFLRDGFAPAAAAAAVAVARQEGYSGASVSREHRQGASVRSDQTQWVELDDVALSPLVAAFEALRLEVNAEAWLGLTRFDVQLAHFASGGAGYARHRDAFRGSAGRRLTAVSYLNEGWLARDGGQLRLYGSPNVDVEPCLGRLVVFLSASVEHEVLPMFASRYAATAWYYSD